MRAMDATMRRRFGMALDERADCRHLHEHREQPDVGEHVPGGLAVEPEAGGRVEREGRLEQPEGQA